MSDAILQKFLALRCKVPAYDPKNDKKNKKINKTMNLQNEKIDVPVIQQIIEEKPKIKIVVQYLQARLDELNDLELNA